MNYKTIFEQLGQPILNSFEGHPYKDVVAQRVSCHEYSMIGGTIRKDMPVETYKDQLSGLGSSRLPEILMGCKDENIAETAVQFATTIALNTGHKPATAYAAEVGLMYANDPKLDLILDIVLSGETIPSDVAFTLKQIRDGDFDWEEYS